MCSLWYLGTAVLHLAADPDKRAVILKKTICIVIYRFVEIAVCYQYYEHSIYSPISCLEEDWRKDGDEGENRIFSRVNDSLEHETVLRHSLKSMDIISLQI